MKRWETYFITTALAAGLTGAPLLWAQQQMPKPAVPPSPPAAAPVATPTTPSVAPTSAAVTGAQVNINSADEAALTSVKGIGKAKAKAIIEYREKNGPFQSIDDLTKIKGIKSKSLQKFKSQLTVG